MGPSEGYGWAGDFATLIAAEPAAVARHLAEHLVSRGEEQFAAWTSSVRVLRQALTSCVEEVPESAWFAAVLEYELPRNGRRLDVVVLENGTVLVIEMKETGRITAAALDQVEGYARDLSLYQSACHERRVVPMLVPIGYVGPRRVAGPVVVVPPALLGAEIVALTSPPPPHAPDTQGWLAGAYDPLPGLAEAARTLFHQQPLPRIKRAELAGVPAIVEALTALAAQAQHAAERHLVFVTGVPGSGKTLLGLSLVHSNALARLIGPSLDAPAPAVFLSGNDPLVDVLQKALRSKDFVQPLRVYLSHMIARSAAAPREHVVVFDEAQRAWNAKKVLTKHRGALGERSEPELLLSIAERIPDWCLVIALVGEEQEIHVGEEGGLSLWAEAVARRPGWTVHAAPRLAEAVAATVPDTRLDLTTTLRTHAAGDVHRWVALLLDGRLDEARAIMPDLRGYASYVTRDLDVARRYVRERYAGRGEARYGLLASSCAENLRGHVLRIKEDGTGANYGRWYEGRPSGKYFCNSLETGVSEFGCQGLELDYAILCWGDDLSWTGTGWSQKAGKKRVGARDRQRLRRNSYRVLLTRGRDGTCIFVPPGADQDATHSALQAAGVRALGDE